MPVDGLRIVFDNESPDENTRRVTDVGVIPPEGVMRGHKLKKHPTGTTADPAFVFPNVSLAAVQTTVGFLGRTQTLGNETIEQLKEIYVAAKLIGSESLIQACVDRAWELRVGWMEDPPEDLETEHAWMYLVMSEREGV